MQQEFFQPSSCALFGVMRGSWREGALLALDFDASMQLEPELGDLLENRPENKPEIRQTWAWLTAYFADQPLPSLPKLQPKGTAFQQRVWAELLNLSWGERITYAELARRVDSAPRAVGGALRANPIPILIPCHRVVAATGLGGYAGASALGQARKKWLLEHEKAA